MKYIFDYFALNIHTMFICVSVGLVDYQNDESIAAKNAALKTQKSDLGDMLSDDLRANLTRVVPSN